MNAAKQAAGAATVLCVALNPAIDLTIEVSDLRVGEVNRAQRAQQDAGGKGCAEDLFHGVRSFPLLQQYRDFVEMSSILPNKKWFCGAFVFLYPRRQLCYNKATAGGFV